MASSTRAARAASIVSVSRSRALTPMRRAAAAVALRARRSVERAREIACARALELHLGDEMEGRARSARQEARDVERAAPERRWLVLDRLRGGDLFTFRLEDAVEEARL